MNTNAKTDDSITYDTTLEVVCDGKKSTMTRYATEVPPQDVETGTVDFGNRGGLMEGYAVKNTEGVYIFTRVHRLVAVNDNKEKVS